MGGGGGGFRTFLARFVGYGPGARDLRTIELGTFGILAKDEAHIFCSAIQKNTFFFFKKKKKKKNQTYFMTSENSFMRNMPDALNQSFITNTYRTNCEFY
jgi:hypothetical protein